MNFLREWCRRLAFLLACFVFCSPTNAEVLSLQELDQGANFTIGNLEFFDWQVPATTINTNVVTVTTIDNVDMPGFVVDFNGEMSIPGPENNDEHVNYFYSVRTVNEQPAIFGASLLATDFEVFTPIPTVGETLSTIEITAAQASVIDLAVVLHGIDQIAIPDDPDDEGVVNPPLNLLALSNFVEVRIEGTTNGGHATLNSYQTVFTVPEPGTALMMGLGLAGLSVVVGLRRLRFCGKLPI